MRHLAYATVVALLAPLTACYVGNTPPRSRADAGGAVDAGTQVDSGPGYEITYYCRTNDDCPAGATCDHAPTVWYCQHYGTPDVDAGTPVTPPTAAQCRALCDGRYCGTVHDPACGDVDCGQCREGSYCDEEYAECVIRSQEPPHPPPPDTRPRWTLRVVGARVNACNTDWDRCSIAPPLCTPSRPDPVVRVNGRATNEASNTCAATYDTSVGNFLAEELAAGVRVDVVDNDSPVANHVSGDTICEAFIAAFSAADLTAGRRSFTCSGGGVDFTLTAVR